MLQRRRKWDRVAGGLADLTDDVLVELSSRQARALLMVLAVGLSTGALLASVGISTAASQQIESDIAASTLDLVTISVAPGQQSDDRDARPTPATGNGEGPMEVLPPDTEARLASVDLVASAGRRLGVSQATEISVTRLPNQDTAVIDGVTGPDVVAASAGYLRAAQVGAPAERLFLLDHIEPVVLLGPEAAEKLDVPVTEDPTGLQVWINDAPFDVVGFLDGGGPAALGNAVVIPYQLGLNITGNDWDASVLVRTLPGAGAPVAKVITEAIRPDAPERLEASPVVSIDSLRRGVSTQMDKLALWTGIVLMALTILLIANSMVVAVMARATEIGLRRALGSSRPQVAATFLSEGALIGLLGGLVGAGVACVAVVTTCALNGWTSVLDPAWTAVGPFIGVGVGLVASAYPAARATHIHPAQAVRSE